MIEENENVNLANEESTSENFEENVENEEDIVEIKENTTKNEEIQENNKKTKKNKKVKREKYKFSETWGKLFLYCKRFLPAIIIALIFAVGGTVFTILGPDKMSDMTAVITEGFGGNMDLKLITSIALTLVAFYASSVVLSYCGTSKI